jgi:deoxyadenosine/deoxycytidine kinase|tara:strand:+ start:351 stop:1052 length:702 start_codon:yes stop_codon:yes gene_type:complete
MGRPIIISLEGNIGAGKSTFLDNLESHLGKQSGWVFLREPVHIWDQIRDQNGETILSKFYANPDKYAFSFQIMAYTTRLHELKRVLKENPGCIGVICERSLDADKHIFAKMLHADGLIDDVMYDIYERYFSEYEGDLTLNGMIYVEAEPEVCFQRVAKRSRDGESNIALDYLQKCHEYHCKWIQHTETQVLTLNVNDDVEVSVLQGKMRSWLYEAESFLRTFVEKTYSINASA